MTAARVIMNAGNRDRVAGVSEPARNSIDARLVDELRAMLGEDGIVSRATELKVYECDGWTVEKSMPDLVLRPRNTAEVSAILKLLYQHGVAFVPRGAGTGLSGGCLPLAPVMICTSRMNRIVAIDLANRRVEVESGVVNLHVTNAVKADGFFYAPDPSSQMACTIGGNVAENSGGPHTLKYGVTTNHITGLRMVLPDGEIVSLGGNVEDSPGYDLVGLVVGSEGTFGIVTEVTARLTPLPQAYRTLLGVFDSIDDCTKTVSDIIAEGILPGALEMIDQLILQAIEDAFHFGFPRDAKAVLIIELDGFEAGLDTDAGRVREICMKNN